VLIKTTFDWVKHINHYKTPIEKFSEEDWDLFVSYTVHKVISMNPHYLEVVNHAQTFLPYQKKQIYSFYKEYIPKNNNYTKYIKSSVKQHNKTLVLHLQEYFQISSREIKEYLKILDTNEIIIILSNMGIEEKEIKKLLKWHKRYIKCY